MHRHAGCPPRAQRPLLPAGAVRRAKLVQFARRTRWLSRPTMVEVLFVGRIVAAGY